MIEVEEVYYQWLKGVSLKGISRSLGISRNTVKKLIGQAGRAGLTRQSSVEEITHLRDKVGKSAAVSKERAPIQAYLSQHHLQIEAWHHMPHMTVTQMVRLLKDQCVLISETSLRRYVRHHFGAQPISTVHLETIAGQQGQVDFGYVGMMMDPVSQKARKAYVFIMSLAHSRHRFVRFVFRQDVATWIDCHIRAFHFFGGVPATIMLDNLKAGVLKADIYDPVINRTYGELERHYGFVCDPNKVRVARHKGKVERSVTIVRQQLLAGKSYKDIEDANIAALHWCRHEIGQRICRTTGYTPWDLFEREEKACLQPLPATDYDCALWQELKVHRDHHVVFEGSYYSVSTAYIGQTVWLRSTSRMVEIYVNHQKIKTHVRSQSRGSWVTDLQDYTQGQQAFLNQDKSQCLQQAQQIGPFTMQFLEKVLTVPTRIGQRKAQAVLRLAKAYGESRLESACQRSVSFDNYGYRSLKKILAHRYEDQQDTSTPASLAQQTSYVRSIPACIGGVQ